MSILGAELGEVNKEVGKKKEDGMGRRGNKEGREIGVFVWIMFSCFL